MRGGLGLRLFVTQATALRAGPVSIYYCFSSYSCLKNKG